MRMSMRSCDSILIMFRYSWLALGMATASLVGYAQGQTAKTFDMYVVDTEGGHAVLYVSPTGESVLEDTGNPGGRDTDRIMAIMDAAGVKQIDHLILTHYHVDHVGGVEELLKRTTVKHFIDHGATVEPREQVADFQKKYAEWNSKAKHTVVKPGDKIPFAGIDAVVVTSNGEVIKKPLAGGGKPNPECADFKERDESRVDPENPQSVGVVYQYGKFRTINLGDFTWNKEKELMCPNNPIGKVDVYLTSHHGIDQSGSPALVHALAPMVAIMHNGTRKGGAIQTMMTLYSSPGLQEIWQNHWSYTAGLEYNTPSLFIANIEDPAAIAAALTAPPAAGRGGPGGPGGPGGAPPQGAPATGAAPGAQGAAPAAGGPPAGGGAGRGAGGGGRGGGGGGRGGGHTGPAFWIKVSARADGSFTVTNTRNNFSKTYNTPAK
jgi:competence protein ComEC